MVSCHREDTKRSGAYKKSVTLVLMLPGTNRPWLFPCTQPGQLDLGKGLGHDRNAEESSEDDQQCENKRRSEDCEKQSLKKRR